MKEAKLDQHQCLGNICKGNAKSLTLDEIRPKNVFISDGQYSPYMSVLEVLS